MKKNHFVFSVFLCAIMFTLASCGEDKAIKAIKAATLADFPKMTVGEAFDGVYHQSEWSVSRDGGKASVWCKGTVLYADEPTRLYIGFSLDEDTGAFEVSDMLLDNAPLTAAMQIKTLCDIFGEDAVEMLVTRIEDDIKQATALIKKAKKAKGGEQDALLAEYESLSDDIQGISRLLNDDDLKPSQMARLKEAMWDLSLAQM